MKNIEMITSISSNTVPATAPIMIRTKYTEIEKEENLILLSKIDLIWFKSLNYTNE